MGESFQWVLDSFDTYLENESFFNYLQSGTLSQVFYLPKCDHIQFGIDRLTRLDQLAQIIIKERDSDSFDISDLERLLRDWFPQSINATSLAKLIENRTMHIERCFA